MKRILTIDITEEVKHATTEAETEKWIHFPDGVSRDNFISELSEDIDYRFDLYNDGDGYRPDFLNEVMDYASICGYVSEGGENNVR